MKFDHTIADEAVSRAVTAPDGTGRRAEARSVIEAEFEELAGHGEAVLIRHCGDGAVQRTAMPDTRPPGLNSGGRSLNSIAHDPVEVSSPRASAKGNRRVKWQTAWFVRWGIPACDRQIKHRSINIAVAA